MKEMTPANPISQAFSWIVENTVSEKGLLLSPCMQVFSCANTASMIPVWLQNGNLQSALDFGVWLHASQSSIGSLPGDAEFGAVYSTGLAVRGWVSLLDSHPPFEEPIRNACRWLVRNFSPEPRHASKDSKNLNWILARRPDQKGDDSLPAVIALLEAGKKLNDQTFTGFAELALDHYINHAYPIYFDPARFTFDEFTRANRFLLDAGCLPGVKFALQSFSTHHTIFGDIPYPSNSVCVFPSGLANLAAAYFILGDKVRARSILEFLKEFQNPGGGFFGSYGVRASYFPAEEMSHCVVDFLSASLANFSPQGDAPIESAGSSAGSISLVSYKSGGDIHSQSSGKRQKKVLLVSYLYDDNFGDVLIYQTVRDRLRKAGFKTDSIEINQPIRISDLINRTNQNDFLYFVGGGLIERWAPELISHFDEIYPHLKVPYGVVGLSSGRFDYTRMNPSLKVFADKAAFFYARDKETVDTFRKAGAIRLPSAGVDVVFANREVAKQVRTGESVVAGFRDVPYPTISGDLDWSAWASALKQCGVSGLLPDASDAQKRLGLPVAVEDELTALSKSSFVIAMRYHVILSAAMMGVLPIAIDYCPKVRRLCQQLQIEDYCLSQNEPSKLPLIFASLKERRTMVQKHLEKKTAELQKQATGMLDETVRFVEAI